MADNVWALCWWLIGMGLVACIACLIADRPVPATTPCPDCGHYRGLHPIPKNGPQVCTAYIRERRRQCACTRKQHDIGAGNDEGGTTRGTHGRAVGAPTPRVSAVSAGPRGRAAAGHGNRPRTAARRGQRESQLAAAAPAAHRKETR